MASPFKGQPVNTVVFDYGPLWDESLISASKDTPNILKKIEEFQEVKSRDPLTPFGPSDNRFKSEGKYAQYMPKARKAHLSSDMSIVYELSGRNPTTIKLYGVFTHAQLGTGQPPNIKIQQNMAKRLAKEDADPSDDDLNNLIESWLR